MYHSPAQYRNIRRKTLSKSGIHAKAIDYIIDLELNAPMEKMIDLDDLSRVAAWPGRRVYLTGSSTALVWDGTIWRLDHGPAKASPFPPGPP